MKRALFLAFVCITLAENIARADGLNDVSTDYLSNVRPIFAKKCFDCHSHLNPLPWYANLPIVGYLIKKDISEATSDMDMSKDFPFIGKGTPEDYLDVLGDAVTDGSMPPWRYRIAHPGSALSESDKAAILGWIDRSRRQLAP